MRKFKQYTFEAVLSIIGIATMGMIVFTLITIISQI